MKDEEDDDALIGIKKKKKKAIEHDFCCKGEKKISKRKKNWFDCKPQKDGELITYQLIFPFRILWSKKAMCFKIWKWTQLKVEQRKMDGEVDVPKLNIAPVSMSMNANSNDKSK